MAVARVPIFYMRVGRSIRLGKCVSWCKLIDGKNVSCHEKLYYLQCGQPNILIPAAYFL